MLPFKKSINPKETLPIAIITLTSFFLCLQCIKDGHAWGDDFALYIAQAKAICEGDVEELYKANKYSMDHSTMHIGPYLYPFGFPLLLTLVYAVFGLNFVAMKVFCALFFAASLPLLYLLARRFFINKIFSFVPLILIAFNTEFIIFNSSILSDLPFFFFCLLSLWLMELRITLRNQFITGVIIFYAYFIRDAGIILLPVLFIKQFGELKKDETIKKRVLMIPYGIFAFLFLIIKLSFPPGSQNHYHKFISDLSLERSLSYCSYYYEQLKLFFFEQTTSTLLFLPVALLALIGAVVRFKTYRHHLVFFILSWILVCAWPELQGVRFLFPLVPIFIFFALAAADAVCQQKSRIWIAGTALSILMIIFIISNNSRVQNFSKGDTNEAYTQELLEVYDQIKKNTGTGDVIGVFKPRALRLFTGRNTIYTDAAKFKNSSANFLLAEKENGALLPFEKVFQTKTWILYSK